MPSRTPGAGARPAKAQAQRVAGNATVAQPRPLTAKQARFVDEYLIDLNATKAAIRAGYSAKTADVIGAQLLRKTSVAAAVAARRAEVSEAARIDAAWVLKQWAAIAAADPNDLVQYRRECCRHCWGVGFAYQWTPAELQRARAQARAAKAKAPDASGGVGFDRRRAPNPECPECNGDGHGRMVVADTRKLPASARALYAGVRLGKDGLQVLMQDKAHAVANIARHLGLFQDRLKVEGSIDVAQVILAARRRVAR